MAQSPPKKPFSKKKAIINLIVLIIAIVIIVAFIAYVYNTFINVPQPQVTETDGHDGFQGLNYVYFVDVTVKNNGASGWITVYAEINGAGKYEQQNKRVYVDDGQANSMQFVFDIGFLSGLGALVNPPTYRAWANAG